jgi:hypothetical protein
VSVRAVLESVCRYLALAACFAGYRDLPPGGGTHFPVAKHERKVGRQTKVWMNDKYECGLDSSKIIVEPSHAIVIVECLNNK